MSEEHVPLDLQPRLLKLNSLFQTKKQSLIRLRSQRLAVAPKRPSKIALTQEENSSLMEEFNSMLRRTEPARAISREASTPTTWERLSRGSTPDPIAVA